MITYNRQIDMRVYLTCTIKRVFAHIIIHIAQERELKWEKEEMYVQKKEHYIRCLRNFQVFEE